MPHVDGFSSTSLALTSVRTRRNMACCQTVKFLIIFQTFYHCRTISKQSRWLCRSHLDWTGLPRMVSPRHTVRRASYRGSRVTVPRKVSDGSRIVFAILALTVSFCLFSRFRSLSLRHKPPTTWSITSCMPSDRSAGQS